MYAISLANYIKKKRNEKAKAVLRYLNLNQLAMKCKDADIPSKNWINHLIEGTDIRIVSGQQIELLRRMSCDFPKVYFYFEIHKGLFNKHPSLILKMDETMLSARKRLKVLARKGKLPLIPENIKLPHLTGCVTISASGHLFKPLIILPNKKTMRYLGKFTNHAYLASSSAGWMTKNLFSISVYCLYVN